jgi:hypothetical protein
MKKLACIIGIIFIAIAVAAKAEEASISPFIGTWGGQWADMTGKNKQRHVGIIKLIGDGQGGVIIESWESGGRKLNLKNPPKVVQNAPDELIVLWPNGNKTTLTLDGSLIRAENRPVSGSPWDATFQREK